MNSISKLSVRTDIELRYLIQWDRIFQDGKSQAKANANYEKDIQLPEYYDSENMFFPT